MNKKWQIFEPDKNKIEEIKNKYKVNQLLATILANRNILKEEDIRLFLNPTRNDFYNPFLITDMDIAVNRIIKAIENKENITIYGDYDVDGITSITVLKSFLNDIGVETNTYIPNRLIEGYGLNKEAIDKISKKGCNLMITVDCGISAIEEIEYANSLGIETIITDHHEAGNEIPKAIAVIDNKRKDSKYPFRELAGVGVVFKLIQAIGITLKLKEESYLKYLDIVCIGTISDIVPLVDENRVIAKLGLLLVAQTKNIGLRSIINSSGYNKIDSNTISFGVAPRINACGRMGKAEEALELFLSKDKNEVNELTNKLNEHNRKRQETEKTIFENAVEKIKEEHLDENKAIIVGGENWHHGVIGIVSSKITEMYFKPSILFSFEEDGIGKGSGRSIPGFDLHEALMKCSDTIEKFGGHSMAVGITVKKDNLEKFKKEFEQIATQSKIDEIIPIINIDAKVDLSDIDKEMVESLKQLEPFGEANKMPVFAFKNLKIDSIRALSEGKHLKLTLKDNNYIINAIGFNIGYLANEYRIGDKIDVAGVLEINTFNGVDNLQINIKDIMKSI
ncbi:MAG: single-stranded-DNA-specific exonuclease RecJ [Clostridia bacterium]|jgi:single-stranded-DNA-specific exonuclease|nr:single-stranded-DNA-specific exonuclease RecJ [Clostridia bacterium]MBP8633944.1 single-stranded-DNA-specific exonuclease RecJ [Clostridia bacterium]MBP9922000.1 single-stranded-DNA-specific exonuclease RecJ [Clostridia bacterium]CDC06325.1 exonuclease RecJ [Clostridium sp. CAG:343]HCF34558.1 single-stranded-DNA-specific exonuclease RecJ [Clostridiales bacterium]